MVSTDTCTPVPLEGCKFELTYLAGYIPRWYTHPKTVTHRSTNRARRALTSFVRRTPLTTTPRRQPSRQETNTHPFNDPFSGTTRVDFTEARDSEWQWHLLGHMQVCTSLHASTPPLIFLQAGCPSRRTTNSVKALNG